jgi:mediator of RNA polymerase II transcription subunit 16
MRQALLWGKCYPLGSPLHTLHLHLTTVHQFYFLHLHILTLLDNTLLLAAYDVSSRLHLYRVEAKWNVPTLKQGQHPPKLIDKPELLVSEIHVEDSCYPISSVDDGDLNPGPESGLRIPAQLTHLNFLPITPEKEDGTLPTIQAIFSTPPNIVSFDHTQPQQSPCSITVKWEVHHTQQNQLHSSLDKVTSKKKSIGSVPARSVFVLKRQPDIIMHSVILAFFPLWYNMLLAFCYSDGTIEFRKRSTMEPISPDYNTETVTSLSQAGFSFTPLNASLHISLSPNHCMAACMQQDGSIKLRSAEYAYGSLFSDEEDPKHSAALAALILQFSSTANQYFSSDDIFAIIGPLSEKRKRDFVYLMFQGLQLDVDCGIDDTTNPNKSLVLLGRTPFFVKTLSAAHLLGLNGAVERSVVSKTAWMILNIKYITQILTTIMRMHGQIEKSPLRPEVVPQFVGICRWIMNFMAYILDELFAVGYKLRNDPPPVLDRATLQSKIEEMNKPALLLLLCSFPRMMMKAWATPLAWVIRTATTYSNSSPTPEVRRIYAPLHQALSECPFDWRLFETVVSEAQALVRGCYKHANLTDAQRNECERQLILGEIPEVLFPAAKRLVTDALFGEKGKGIGTDKTALSDKLDVAKIMFYDTTWLGLQHSKRAKNWFDTHVVDVCQKMIIRGTGTTTHATGPTNPTQSTSQSQSQGGNRSDIGGGPGPEDKKGGTAKSKLRICTRCGAYMEDVVQGMPGYTVHHVSWLMGVAKHCVCGNAWMAGEEKARLR